LPKYGSLPYKDWKKPPSLEHQNSLRDKNWITSNRKSLSVNTNIDREVVPMETAIYGRVSTEEQAMEGYSIRGQVEKLKSYVSAKSWFIYDVYLDEGISGKNMTERPAITRMMEDIIAGRVKNVLVFKLDRLTRSVADLVYLIDLFKNYGCAFNSLCEMGWITENTFVFSDCILGQVLVYL
jgi:DNA invertase Pin-like site-specific DNA recombinase